MAFSARMAQASSSAGRLCIFTYVDDPIMLACGNAERIRQTVIIVLAVWLALGHRPARSKSKMGELVQWISVVFCITHHDACTAIKQELLGDTANMCTEIVGSRVYGLKRLRTLWANACTPAGCCLRGGLSSECYERR